MPKLNNIHWTADKDLLERYVLNRLEPEEREGLELHVATCDVCREAVTAEQHVVAAVRRAARDNLKSRLKARVSANPLRRVNWYQVAGIAATIVFLVTVGIVNHWLFVGGTKEEEVAEGSKSKLAAPVDELGRLRGSKAAPAEAKDKKAGRPEESVAHAAGAGSREKGAERKSETTVSKVPITLKQEKAREAQVEEAKLATRPDARGRTERLDQAVAETDAVWVEGTILRDRAKESAAPQFAIQKGARKTTAGRERKLDLKAEVSEAQQRLTEPAEPEAFTVSQRSPAALAQQQKEKQRAGNTVQTLLERKESGLFITLYADPEFDDSTLRNAHVEIVGEDSVVVNIGLQRIGYRLPTGWGQQALEMMKRKR